MTKSVQASVGMGRDLLPDLAYLFFEHPRPERLGRILRVPAAIGEPAGSAGKGRGDDGRGVQRDLGRGEEAEGASCAGPAQRPRSAALSRGEPSTLRCDGGRTGKKAQREEIGGHGKG